MSDLSQNDSEMKSLSLIILKVSIIFKILLRNFLIKFYKQQNCNKNSLKDKFPQNHPKLGVKMSLMLSICAKKIFTFALTSHETLKWDEMIASNVRHIDDVNDTHRRFSQTSIEEEEKRIVLNEKRQKYWLTTFSNSSQFHTQNVYTCNNQHYCISEGREFNNKSIFSTYVV